MKLMDQFQFDNGLIVRNRVVLAPMTIGACETGGYVSQADRRYYSKRAEQVGLIITGCAYVDPLGEAFEHSFGVDTDAHIEGLANLAKAIQDKGAKAILQIYHGGRMVCPEVTHQTPVAPSAIKAERTYTAQPRALSAVEVEEVMQKFLDAIRRAILAGFDGVELHGANTYLIQQFVSPHSNRRQDKWGGTLNNRMRFSKTLVKKAKQLIKELATKPFVLGYRFSPEEKEEPGITLHDTLQLIEQLIHHKVDYLHISTSDVWRGSIRSPENTEPVIKKIIKKIDGRVPFIGVGQINTGKKAQDVLDSGVPLVALGKSLLLDPEWSKKVSEDRERDIITVYHDSLQEQLALPTQFVEELRGYLEGQY